MVYLPPELSDASLVEKLQELRPLELKHVCRMRVFIRLRPTKRKHRTKEALDIFSIYPLVI